MLINVESVEHTTYRPMFSKADIPMVVAHVHFPEHDIHMTLSHREDDGDGVWCADSRIDKGMPIFVHGDGERTCRKSMASGVLLDKLNALL